MNQGQLKYAKEKLTAARSAKYNLLPSRYGFPDAKKDELFAAGEYGVEKINGNYRIHWVGEQEWIDERRKEREAIEKDYRKTLDELMLGDNAAALELINKFIGE